MGAGVGKQRAELAERSELRRRTQAPKPLWSKIRAIGRLSAGWCPLPLSWCMAPDPDRCPLLRPVLLPILCPDPLSGPCPVHLRSTVRSLVPGPPVRSSIRSFVRSLVWSNWLASCMRCAALFLTPRDSTGRQERMLEVFFPSRTLRAGSRFATFSSQISFSEASNWCFSVWKQSKQSILNQNEFRKCEKASKTAF